MRLEQCMNELQAKQTVLSTKRDTAVVALDSMTKRADALLRRIESKMSGALSNAEKDYLLELEDVQSSLTWYQTKLKEVCHEDLIEEDLSNYLFYFVAAIESGKSVGVT